MNDFKTLLTACVLAGIGLSVPSTSSAQVSAADSVMNHANKQKLSVGGYGEVTYSREFFSDNVYRYSKASAYKNDPSHGKFDIPHAVIYLSYDFGKGWTMGSEIEFEHGGTGASYEKEYEESGEWEQEVEKGGEVELEQFWIQKSFSRSLNVRFGHIVVPIGLTNAHHEPLNFFTVYRPEGEATIFPCTWHQTGASLWGVLGKFRYEVQLLAGLNALSFSRDNWIQKGGTTAFEFEPSNKYAVALRIDNYSIPGLRLGISGYYGHSIDNSLGREASKEANSRNLKGAVTIGTFDFTYNAHNWIVRGNFDYGHLGDANDVRLLTGRQTKTSPFNRDYVGKAAMATGIEAGWDVFSQIQKMRQDKQKFYVFGHYEYYNSYIPTSEEPSYPYTKKNRMAFGVNYYPIPQIALKAEYSKRFLKSGYNDEPSISVGIAYEGFFL
ncbi:MAG: hypothetical protein KBA74_02975 [Prevotella sp.]|jgi:hypothetical protein|nr:hypothetical protein [Prevotella sp.]MBP7097630.1 hypothetical protein [Prevotella sp.]MBP8686647.1 hypothetical protein [Prevotella sp.]MCI1731398.1 hypothetical protein [Prevotella sp.]